MIPLADMRQSIYFDWSIRDLVLRAVIHLHNNGWSKNEIDQLIEYLIRKIREDYNHISAVLEIARIFERKGCHVILTELRNRVADLIVLTPRAQLLLLEVKPTPPPWGGLNAKEREEYELVRYPVYYVWKQSNGWYYTTVENVKNNNGKLFVEKKYPIAKLLEIVSFL